MTTNRNNMTPIPSWDRTDYSREMPQAGAYNYGATSTGSGSLLVAAMIGAAISVLSMWLL